MLLDFYSLFIGFAKIYAMKDAPGKWRIFAAYTRIRLKNRWYLWTGIKKTNETFFGFKVRFFEYSTFAYLFEEIFIEDTYRFRTLKTNPVIFDAGSNIGISVIYLKWLYPAARIRAFEPDPQTFALLKENVEINGLKDVELYNLALSSRKGEVLFHSDRQGSLGASLHKERNLLSQPQVVLTQSLCDFLDEPVDFMKMDIEGAESECLNDVAKRGLLKGINEMVIECHHNLPGKDRILTEVLPVLESNGYGYQIRAAAHSSSAINSQQDVILHVYKNP